MRGTCKLHPLLNRLLNSSAVRSTSALVGGHLFSAVVVGVSTLIEARFVSPVHLGTYQSFAIATAYVGILNLGVVQALQRHLPFYIGQGEHKKAEELASISQAWILLVAAGVSSVFLALSALALFRGDFTAAAGWAAQVFLAFSMLCLLYLTSTYRASAHFVKLAKGNAIQGVTALVSVPLVILHPYYGLCLRRVIPQAIMGLYLLANRPLRIVSKIKWRELTQMVKFGLPLSFVGYMDTSFWPATLNLFVLHVLGKGPLGLLAFTLSVQQALLTVPGAVSQVFMPRIAMTLGQTGRIKDVFRVTIWPTVLTVLCCLPIAIAFSWLIGPVVTGLMPKYTGAIAALRWAAFLMPVAAMNIPVYILVASKQVWQYAVSTFAGSIVGILAAIIAIRSGFGITGVVVATITGKAVIYLTACLFICLLLRNEQTARATGVDVVPSGQLDRAPDGSRFSP